MRATKQAVQRIYLFSAPTRQAILRTYGCFFAEFLNEESLVRLGLLDLPTCVGLRYGCHNNILRRFSRRPALRDFQNLAIKNFHDTWKHSLKNPSADLPTLHPYAASVKSNNAPNILRFVTPSIIPAVLEY